MNAVRLIFILFSASVLLWGCSGVVDNESLSPRPLAAVSLAVTPVSPSNNTTPAVSGTTTASASLKLYAGAACSGSQIASGSADSSGAFSLTSSVLTEGSYQFSVLATASGGSTCSDESVAYAVDTTPPLYTISAPSLALVHSASAAVTYTTSYISTATVDLQAANIVLNKTGTANCSVTVADGTTSAPTVSLSNCTGSGSVGMSFNEGSATDDAGNLAASFASRTFLVDNSGVSTAVFNPATSIVNSLPPSVTITFSEPLDGTSVAAADFAVSGSCGTRPTLAVSGVVGNVISVTLAGGVCALGETTVITLDLTGIKDAVGNSGTGSVAVTYTVDNIGPTAAGFSVLSSRVAAIPASLALTMNESVEPASVTLADFSVAGTCSPLPVLAVTDVTGPVVTVSLTGATCLPEQTVIVGIDLADVNDVNGNAGSGIFSETYTFDNVGPIATSVTPVTASVAAIPASVAVAFSEDLLATSVFDSDLVISGTCGTLPVASLAGVAGATATFTLAGDVCAVGETVVVTMDGSAITDAAGNAGTGTVTATYTFDNDGPAIISVAPASGTVNAIPASLTFTFDEALLAASVAANDASVIGTCGTLPTLSLISASGSTVVFGLSGAVCTNGEIAAVTLNAANVTDLAGNNGSGSQVASFTIDSVGPAPSAVTPVTAQFISIPTAVSFTFDESVLAGSVANSDLAITGTCTVLPTASVTGVAGAVVSFALSAATCAESQTVILTMLGSSVTDQLGNAGSNSQMVTYTKDTTGPSVLSFAPATGNVISLPTSVNISFDEAVLAGSVAAADFSVSGSCTILPLHAVSGVAGQQVFIGLSGAVCANGQNAIVTVNSPGISDLAGNAGAGTPAVSFNIDSVGPSLTSVTPNAGAPPATVTFSFSENLNAATVADADFILSGTCTTQSLSVSAVTNADVTLSLAGAPCVSGETVIISIDAANVADTVGNSGSGTSFVSFTEP